MGPNNLFSLSASWQGKGHRRLGGTHCATFCLGMQLLIIIILGKRWRKKLLEKNYSMYIFISIKAKYVRWAGHAQRKEKTGTAYKIMIGNFVWEMRSGRFKRGYDLEFFFFCLYGLWGCWHCGHYWPIVPASGDSEDDCGEADGI
jgi:hypothetical protein